MDFSVDELVWINNALNEVVAGPEAIEDWESAARIGAGKDDVRALLRRVGEEVSDLRRKGLE